VSARGERGGGDSRPQAPDESAVVLHEEEASVGTRWEGAGHLRIRRDVESEKVSQEFPRRRDELAFERIPAEPDDSGKIETLADGSISIPLYEEELVVTRRTVLRERVIVRKEEVTDWQTVEAELRQERVSFETDDAQ
jgi:uncharacterized protein (TIGR02271 family)